MKNTNRKPMRDPFWNAQKRPSRRLILFEPMKVKKVSNSNFIPRMIKPVANPFYTKSTKEIPVKKIVNISFVNNKPLNGISRNRQTKQFFLKNGFVGHHSSNRNHQIKTTSFIKRIPNKIKIVKDNANIPKKEMNWIQAKNKYKNLNPFGDADRDGLMNYLDCKPFNPKKKEDVPYLNPDADSPLFDPNYDINRKPDKTEKKRIEYLKKQEEKKNEMERLSKKRPGGFKEITSKPEEKESVYTIKFKGVTYDIPKNTPLKNIVAPDEVKNAIKVFKEEDKELALFEFVKGLVAPVKSKAFEKLTPKHQAEIKKEEERKEIETSKGKEYGPTMEMVTKEGVTEWVNIPEKAGETKELTETLLRKDITPFKTTKKEIQEYKKKKKILASEVMTKKEIQDLKEKTGKEVKVKTVLPITAAAPTTKFGEIAGETRITKRASVPMFETKFDKTFKKELKARQEKKSSITKGSESKEEEGFEIVQTEDGKFKVKYKRLQSPLFDTKEKAEAERKKAAKLVSGGYEPFIDFLKQLKSEKKAMDPETGLVPYDEFRYNMLTKAIAEAEGTQEPKPEEVILTSGIKTEIPTVIEDKPQYDKTGKIKVPSITTWKNQVAEGFKPKIIQESRYDEKTKKREKIFTVTTPGAQFTVTSKKQAEEIAERFKAGSVEDWKKTMVGRVTPTIPTIPSAPIPATFTDKEILARPFRGVEIIPSGGKFIIKLKSGIKTYATLLGAQNYLKKVGGRSYTSPTPSSNIPLTAAAWKSTINVEPSLLAWPYNVDLAPLPTTSSNIPLIATQVKKTTTPLPTTGPTTEPTTGEFLSVEEWKTGKKESKYQPLPTRRVTAAGIDTLKSIAIVDLQLRSKNIGMKEASGFLQKAINNAEKDIVRTVEGKEVKVSSNAAIEKALREEVNKIIEQKGKRVIPVPPKFEVSEGETIRRVTGKEYTDKNEKYLKDLQSTKKEFNLLRRQALRYRKGPAADFYKSEIIDKIDRVINNLNENIGITKTALKEETKRYVSAITPESRAFFEKPYPTELEAIAKRPKAVFSEEPEAPPATIAGIFKTIFTSGPKEKIIKEEITEGEEEKPERFKKFAKSFFGELTKGVKEKQKYFETAYEGFTKDISKTAKRLKKLSIQKFKEGKEKIKDYMAEAERRREETEKDKAIKKYEFVSVVRPFEPELGVATEVIKEKVNGKWRLRKVKSENMESGMRRKIIDYKDITKPKLAEAKIFEDRLKLVDTGYNAGARKFENRLLVKEGKPPLFEEVPAYTYYPTEKYEIISGLVEIPKKEKGLIERGIQKIKEKIGRKEKIDLGEVGIFETDYGEKEAMKEIAEREIKAEKETQALEKKAAKEERLKAKEERLQVKLEELKETEAKLEEKRAAKEEKKTAKEDRITKEGNEKMLDAIEGEEEGFAERLVKEINKEEVNK